MAEKGVNTRIFEAKDKLTKAVNDCLEDGIPISMVSIMVEDIFVKLDNQVELILAKEKENYEKEQSAESEQVIFSDKADTTTN